MIGAIFFLYGLFLGSFYNVLIYRVPLGIPVAKGRSECPNCHTTLKVLDLVPVLSFLFLGAECRYCKTKISFRYPAIELITGILFFVAYNFFGMSVESILFASFWSMLLVITMTDYDHFAVPDSILIGFSIIHIILMVWAGYEWKHYVYGLLVGAVFYGVIYIVAKLIYKKEGFGLGDVTLISAIGIVLGPVMTFTTAMLAFYVSLLGIVFKLLLGKKLKLKEEIPFGPWICISAFFISLYGEQFLDWLLKLLGYK